MSESSADPVARRESRALWAALAVIVVWGANFSVQKAVFAALSPGGFLFVRYLMMPAFAVALLVARYGVRWPRVSRADAGALLRLGLAGHLLHVGMVTYGIHLSTAFSSSLILACTPVYTLLILRYMGLERIGRLQAAGVALALVGVLVFLSDKLAHGRWQASGGDLILVLAASFFAYYTVAGKPLIERLGGVAVMAYATLMGSLPVLLVAWPVSHGVRWDAIGPAIWLALFWAVGVSAFLGWLIWGWVNAVRGVARTAPLQYLMPPVAGVVAWLAAGEQFTPVKLGGAAITLAGVAIAQFAGPAVRDVSVPAD